MKSQKDSPQPVSFRPKSTDSDQISPYSHLIHPANRLLAHTARYGWKGMKSLFGWAFRLPRLFARFNSRKKGS
jgi:hypothetical protein